jgi:hypothetical protein
LKIKTLAFCHEKDVSAARHHAVKRAIQNGNLLPQIAKGVPYSPPQSRLLALQSLGALARSE